MVQIAQPTRVRATITGVIPGRTDSGTTGHGTVLTVRVNDTVSLAELYRYEIIVELPTDYANDPKEGAS